MRQFWITWKVNHQLGKDKGVSKGDYSMGSTEEIWRKVQTYTNEQNNASNEQNRRWEDKQD